MLGHAISKVAARQLKGEFGSLSFSLDIAIRAYPKGKACSQQAGSCRFNSPSCSPLQPQLFTPGWGKQSRRRHSCYRTTPLHGECPPRLVTHLPPLGYLDTFSRASPKGRAKGVAFLVHSSPTEPHPGGDGLWSHPGAGKQPSAADGNHGRCAFAFKRTINALRVNHTNKSRRGLVPKRATKAPIPRPPDGNWPGPGPMFSPSCWEVICVLSAQTPRGFVPCHPPERLLSRWKLETVFPCQPRWQGSVQRTQAKG